MRVPSSPPSSVDGGRCDGGAQGLLLALPVAVSALLFWRGSLDVFNTVKATVVVASALVLLVTWLARGFLVGRLVVPTGRWPWAVGSFVLALTAATLASDSPWRSLVGAPGRHGGWALYTAVALLAVGLATLGEDGRRTWVRTVVVASLPVTGYALLQAAGADPLPWVTVEGGAPVFSTFGNVDFASAWMGIVGVLAVGLARDRTASRRWRQLAVLAVGLVVVTVPLTGSLQGPVILALGLGGHALAAVAARGRPSGGRAAAAVCGLLVLLGVVGAATGLPDQASRSLQTRTPKWAAAIDIAADAPLLGRGPDTFEDWFFAARAPGVAAESGLRRSVDNAHDVPLHLLAGGGILLAGTWLLAVVAVPAWLLRRRIGRLRADPIALGVVLGWVGYLAQAVVSIDVPPIAVLGWALAGLVVGVATAPESGAQSSMAVRPMVVPRSSPVLVAVVVVLLLGPLLLAVTRPVRGDISGWEAEVARARGDAVAAAALTDGWVRLAPWDSRAPAMQGAWLTGLGRLEQALTWQQQALATRPRDLAHALNVARLLAALDREAEASAAYERVLGIDPHTPAVLAEVGLHELGAGEASRGRALLELAVASSADPPTAWTDALDGVTGSVPPQPRMEIGQG